MKNQLNLIVFIGDKVVLEIKSFKVYILAKSMVGRFFGPPFNLDCALFTQLKRCIIWNMIPLYWQRNLQWEGYERENKPIYVLFVCAPLYGRLWL